MTLRVANVTIERGQGAARVVPVRDFSMSVPTGSTTALVGPSGVGKSSLLLAVAGRLTVSAGTIAVDGADLAAAGSSTRVAFVAQDYSVVEFLSALENVMLPLELVGVGRREASTSAAGVLSELGIGDLADRLPGAMSGGQRQRVAVARALVTRPVVLLADEPTASVDRATGTALVADAISSNRARGGHIVLATHDPVIAELCDQVVRLDEPADLSRSGGWG